MNMKRGGLLVYVVMIVVGILGLFFYFNQSRTAAPLQASQPEKKPQQTISVAIATRDLDARTILRAGDFQIKKHGAGEFMDFAGITGGAGQR